MRQYELVIVLKTSLSEAQRNKVLDTIKSFLKESKIVKENIWGQKVLSYPIEKEDTGYYVQYYLESEASIPTDLEKKVLSSNGVLRHLLLRTK